MNVMEIYAGSDGAATKALFDRLALAGPQGILAINLFRAQKASARAKVYHGGIRGLGSFRRMAYDRKQWAIDNVCKSLEGAKNEPIYSTVRVLGITYGWKQDPKCLFGEDAAWVLYVDLPNGQVSFHSPVRGQGPDYHGEWDGKRESCERILAFCEATLKSIESRQLTL